MKEVKFYDFDLDRSAEERWGHIFDDYQNSLETLCGKVEDFLKKFGVAVLLMKPIYDNFPKKSIMYYDEICYIAKRIGLPVYKVLLMQLIYETASACTTSVLKFGKHEFFFRTMDWPMSFLKNITIGLNIIKGNKIMARVVSWLGYIGFLTVDNLLDNYTISINHRRTQPISLLSLVKNFGRTVTMNWPIGYLVRNIVENRMDVYTAKSLLETSQLISPCYITLYVPNFQTYIITRDCDKLINTRTNELIQTNCDFNKSEPNILWSLERRKHIQEIQKKLEEMDTNNETITCGIILEMLLKHPVENEESIYLYYQYGDEIEAYIFCE